MPRYSTLGRGSIPHGSPSLRVIPSLYRGPYPAAQDGREDARLQGDATAPTESPVLSAEPCIDCRARPLPKRGRASRDAVDIGVPALVVGRRWRATRYGGALQGGSRCGVAPRLATSTGAEVAVPLFRGAESTRSPRWKSLAGTDPRNVQIPLGRRSLQRTTR